MAHPLEEFPRKPAISNPCLPSRRSWSSRWPASPSFGRRVPESVVRPRLGRNVRPARSAARCNIRTTGHRSRRRSMRSRVARPSPALPSTPSAKARTRSGWGVSPGTATPGPSVARLSKKHAPGREGRRRRVVEGHGQGRLAPGDRDLAFLPMFYRPAATASASLALFGGAAGLGSRRLRRGGVRGAGAPA